MSKDKKDKYEIFSTEYWDTFQQWKGMSGAIAFHLIERHANGWGEVEEMMQAWLRANK